MYFDRLKVGLLGYFNLTYETTDSVTTIVQDSTIASNMVSDSLSSEFLNELITYSPECVITVALTLKRFL